MAEYLSSFPTGFDRVVERRLPEVLRGARPLRVFDGLVHFRYEGDARDLRRVPFLNNTFCVLLSFPSPPSFERMVASVCGGRRRYPIDRGTYRVRFSQSNRFTAVPKPLARRAEAAVQRDSKLQPDRVAPQTELWYIIRSEGVGFYGQLLHKREATEKTLHRGELRPELAHLMCACAQIRPEDTVADPFCGYGAIPKQLADGFSFSRLLVSDLDEEKLRLLQTAPFMRDRRAVLSREDALDWSARGVDAIVTDPPWGYYEDLGDIASFYTRMLSSFRRALSPGGRAVILSARKEELLQASARAGAHVDDRIDTLVNGKKAAVFTVSFSTPADIEPESEYHK